MYLHSQVHTHTATEEVSGGPHFSEPVSATRAFIDENMQMGGSEEDPETLAIVSARNILWTPERLLIMLAETYLDAKHF